MSTPEHIPNTTSRQARFSLSCLLCWLLLALFAPALLVSMILLIVDQRRKRTRPQGHPSHIPTTPIHVVNSEVKLYTYGEDLYADMLTSIESARKQIFIETFIWKGDTVGKQFRDALGRAAARGVEVYAIYDSFANLVVPRTFFSSFDPRIHMLAYPFFTLPFNPLSLASYARDHRKILVVDSHVAFLGGYNIGRLYAKHWRDTHTRIIGHDAWEIEASFVDFWNTHRTRELPRLAASTKRDWDPYIQFFRNEPSVLTFPIRSSYYEVIDRARERIYLTQAYFIPNRFLIHLLLKSAERGVDVRILLPAISNHVIADWLGRGFYTACLKAGIRLFLYQDAMVHAKTATIDGIWSTIGTANIDRLSMLGNYEINLAIYSRELATQMENIFHNDTTHARELTLAEWENRPLLHKCAEYFLRPLSPFL